jgi:mRNA-degrading endonuclease RelE of RelBE toxin-antitoxin system
MPETLHGLSARGASHCDTVRWKTISPNENDKHDWRIRVGDYRVIYEIADAIRVVRINRVRHRGEVYR